MTSESLADPVYGFGGMRDSSCEREVAWRSLLGGALTVNLKEVAPLDGRATEADEVAVLVDALARVYGWRVSLAKGCELARTERRVGGIAVAEL